MRLPLTDFALRLGARSPSAWQSVGQDVSRETPRRREIVHEWLADRLRRRVFHVKHPRATGARPRVRRGLFATIAAGALLAAGCVGVAEPSGWAPAVSTGSGDGPLFVQVESGVISAVDLDGPAARLLWRYPTGDDDLGAIYATPVLADGVLYVASHRGAVVALDAATGALAQGWTKPAELDDEVVATPAFDGRRLFVATGGGDIYTVDAASGAVSRLVEGGGRIWGQVVLQQGRLIVGNLDERRVRAFDAETGDLLWETDVAGGVAGDPVMNDTHLIVGSLDRAIDALDPASGEVRWRFKGDGWFVTHPLIDGSILYAGTLDGSVYALDEQTGTQRWHFREEGRTFRASPALLGGTLVVAGRDGEIFGLDPDTGQLDWRQVVVDAQIDAHPLVMGDHLLYPTTDGDLLRVSADGSVERIAVPSDGQDS
jgi:outer membrane protein assembly factor BamB